MILEIEKSKLREDIAELDKLKFMLEKRKKDTNIGFSELAESNKEMRSLKSGDLHRERSMMFSKQSMRSKKVEDQGKNSIENKISSGAQSQDQNEKVYENQEIIKDLQEARLASSITSQEEVVENTRNFDTHMDKRKRPEKINITEANKSFEPQILRN